MSPATERAAQPIVDGLGTCTRHLSPDEVFEVCSRGGEQELNDLLRHAVNRLVRPSHWIMQREQTRLGIARVDLLLSEMGSGAVFAFVEAKMRYATDAVEAPDYVWKSISGDVKKLLAAPPVVPIFFVMWAPYFAHARRVLRYGNGHDLSADGWRPRVSLEECRASMGALLGRAGEPTRVEVCSGTGEDGEITLDGWLVGLDRGDGHGASG